MCGDELELLFEMPPVSSTTSVLFEPLEDFVPPPKPMYYRLRGSSNQAPTGTNPDDVLAGGGHEVKPVEGNPALLRQARKDLRRPDLSGSGLRRLVSSNRPGAGRQLLELASQVELIQPQRQLV